MAKGIKTGGRNKGTPNRTTEEVRITLLKILDENLSSLHSDIQGMKGKERATLLISLAKHCTPPAMNPEKLTVDQLEQILNYLKDNEHK